MKFGVLKKYAVWCVVLMGPCFELYSDAIASRKVLPKGSLKIDAKDNVELISKKEVAQVEKLDKDTLLRTLTGVHTKIFSKDNLLLSPITAEDVQLWNQLIDSIGDFVNDHAENFIPEFRKLQAIGVTLLMGLATIYDKEIKEYLDVTKREKGISDLDPQKIAIRNVNTGRISGAVNLFAYNRKTGDAPQQDLLKIQSDLEKQLKSIRESYFTSRITGDVCEVLIRLALILETTIEKAFTDFRKVLQFQNNELRLHSPLRKKTLSDVQNLESKTTVGGAEKVSETIPPRRVA